MTRRAPLDTFECPICHLRYLANPAATVTCVHGNTGHRLAKPALAAIVHPLNLEETTQ